MATLYDDLSKRPEWSCPACKSKDEEIERLRAAIIAAAYQQGACPLCGARVRVEKRGELGSVAEINHWPGCVISKGGPQ